MVKGGRGWVNATRGTKERDGNHRSRKRKAGEGRWGRDERKGMNEKDRSYMDEGLMRDAGLGREGERSYGGMETLEAAVPGRGAARERRWRLALDDAHHVVVINIRGHETQKSDTLNAAYCDDDNKDGSSDVRWRTYPINVVHSSRAGNRVAMGRENEDTGGATSARRKNPPCKSLPAGTRVIGKEKERTDKSS